jgi:uncharacterized membrane protein YedE/YeeE
MLDLLRAPWPWYVTGPLLGLAVPALLVAGNRPFGVSSNLRHLCAIAAPVKPSFLRYDWRNAGGWNLAFLAGVVLAGALVGWLIPSPTFGIADQTVRDLASLGVSDVSGYVPASLFSWSALATARGIAMIVGGGFLVGFGTAYAGGCTSGHGITGLAALQLPSLVAVAGFFAGGLIATHLLLPWLLG